MILLTLIIIIPLILCVIEMTTQHGVEKKPVSDELVQKLKKTLKNNWKDSE